MKNHKNKKSTKQVSSISHSEMVRVLKKRPEDILATLTPWKMDLLHMSSKLCSEAGELMDAVGKVVYYDQQLDRQNAAEELGDIEFYLEGIRQILLFTRRAVLQGNIDKLSKRYKGMQYSDKAAKERADKK